MLVQKDLAKSRSKIKSKEQSRSKSKKLHNATSQNLAATEQRGSLIGINNQGLYQQSFHPANRMIQREKYR